MPLSWDAFLARYGPMARLIARSLARPPATADDLVQEALLALHEALAHEPGRFGELEHARNYFLRTVRNLALRGRRDAGRERPLEVEPPAVEPPAPAERLARERHELLARCLRELPEADRELIVARYYEGRTLQRLSAQLGIPLSTLYDREKALLALLRRRLARLEGVSEEAAR